MAKALPPPSADRVARFEAYYEVVLPSDYKAFLVQQNGVEPLLRCFPGPRGEHVIERFLPLLDDPNAHGYHGMYDFSVVASQLDARLSDGTREFGLSCVPIAALFAGDFLVLDYCKERVKPTVAVWDHEASEEFSPVCYHISNSFTELLTLLRDCDGGAAMK